MATTKVRISAPMKNKMKFWRRASKKQYDGQLETRTGRELKRIMSGMNMNKSGITESLLKMFTLAGIVYSYQPGTAVSSEPTAHVADIEDANIISTNEKVYQHAVV